MSIQTTACRTEAARFDAATLCEAFQATVALHSERVAVRTLGDGFAMTWGEYGERVRRTAAGLAALGVRRGDTVAMMLTNRPEFHWVDLAAMHLGATAFGLYNTSSQDQLDYVLGDAGSAIVVTEQAFAAKMEQARMACPRLKHVVSVDGAGSVTLDEVDASGDPTYDFDASWRAVQPDDIATLIYTSGTTGPPKGVQLTHAGILASIGPMQQAIAAYRSGFTAISYLPTAHAIARVFEHYYSLLLAGTLTCCADLAGLAATLADTRPSLFIGPPRVWEKLKSGVEAAVATDPDGALGWAIEVGLRHVRGQQVYQPSTPLVADHERAEALVLSPLRARLGFDRLEAALVGAAPTPSEVIEFFCALGVPLREAYGMTEVLVATVNPPDRIKIGTVGLPLAGMELRLAADGEILMRSPQTMVGYRNMPKQTAETIDTDGWVHSGDIGELDKDGYLRIIDRKKELIINTSGHNMSPANIEARLTASSPLICQAVCIGDQRPYNVARNPLTLDEVAAGVARANAQLALPERIQRWTLLDHEWPPGGDELTPTMKLRRTPITNKYAAEINALYATPT